eukprot:COSAG02_NODE_560_length_20328_cov_15.507343_4_plen_132_part_00
MIGACSQWPARPLCASGPRAPSSWMAGGEQWERALLSQLTTRNTLQDGYFREVLSVHGQTASDERQYRKVAQEAPPSEVHAAVLLENVDLQRRVQEAEQQVEALSAENESLKAQILVRGCLYRTTFRTGIR